MSKIQYPKNIFDNNDCKGSVFQRLGSKSFPHISPPNNLGKHVLLKSAKINSSGKKGTVAKMKKSKHEKKIKIKHKKSHNDKFLENAEAPSLVLDLDLEGADEKFLQKRRLQLQRELRLQLKREKGSSSKKTVKAERKVSKEYSSSSDSSSDSSSSSSSTSSSYYSKRNETRKRKCSPSSDSDDSIPEKKRKSPKTISKNKIDVKKKILVHRKVENPKKQVISKKSLSPQWDKRLSPAKRKSPPRNKPRLNSPKHKRELSPKRPTNIKERRPSPFPRPTRPKSPDRRHKHSPRPRHGGLEKGGKILPVKSSAYLKEMKETFKRKSPDRLREEKDKERLKEKRKRELKTREGERREREKEVEKGKRDAERQKERDEALQRCRERQRERERLDRIERDKRIKDERKEESRKMEVKSDLPSLLDIKTEAPKDQGRRGWDERRQRRPGDSYEFRRMPRSELDVGEERRGAVDRRKEPDYGNDPWVNKEEFHDAPPTSHWGRDWKPRPYDGKWGGEGTGRDGNWREREHYTGRRPPNWPSQPPVMPEEPPIIERPPPVETPRRPPDPVVSVPDVVPVDTTADLEEVLSDISDDADEILNQADDIVDDPVESNPAQIIPVSLSQPSADFFFDSRRPLLDCLSDRGLDFEEISDEELEEEAKMSKGIMDVLGADWESLISKAQIKSPKLEHTDSARRRWRADYVISRIGISEKLAGEDFMKKYLAKLQAEGNDTSVIDFENKEIRNSNDHEIKNEDIKAGSEMIETTSKEIKEEKLDVNAKDMNSKIKMHHSCPAVHAMLAESPNVSPLSRLVTIKLKQALSARTDLSIRRVACGLSAKEPLQLPPCDEALYENSLAIFKAAVV